MLAPFYRISGFRKNSTGTLLIGRNCLTRCAGFRILNLIRLSKTISCGFLVDTDNPPKGAYPSPSTCELSRSGDGAAFLNPLSGHSVLTSLCYLAFLPVKARSREIFSTYSSDAICNASISCIRLSLTVGWSLSMSARSAASASSILSLARTTSGGSDMRL